MDEGELRRGMEAGHRWAAIDDWEEKAPVMVLPDHEYLAVREAKWLQRPAEYREEHPFDPERVLARRERRRARTLERIEQDVREHADNLMPILIENRELIGATGAATSMDHLVAQSTYFARQFAHDFRQDYEEMLAAGGSPESLAFMAQMVRDFEDDLADVEVLRRDPTGERFNWATDRLIARHRATVEAWQSKLSPEATERQAKSNE